MTTLNTSWQTLAVSCDARDVVGVSLNVPAKRNVLSSLMIEELTRVADQLRSCSSTRAVVLRGAGKVFCAGGDLNWMKQQINATRRERIHEATRLAMMLNAWNTLPKPVIGAVHGGAYGGGAGLACVCDVAIAAADTQFGFTETKIGLIPSTIGPYVLARLGEANARRVLMSARLFGADEAVRLGLVARAVPSEDLDSAVEAEVLPYLGTAPGAVGAAKGLALALGSRIDQSAIDESIRRLADTWESDEAAAGIDAFLNRTQPPWTKE